eukprot:TRINITY_DN6819_c0_g1_i1.p1 TRINITY_DN6819_c0_g1~~TRINITY_DN6819_c0_g1_i1.p1  ORF type:complete len:361 (-),score=43.33 TRINITY_DN6819_c0_g1_i1:22-1104(-)
MAGGTKHSLLITTKNEVYVWGEGDEYQLGLGNNRNCNVPQQLHSLQSKKIIQIAGGWNHSLALSQTGKIYRWGSSKFNQIGYIPEGFLQTPTLFFEDKKETIPYFTHISCGIRHSAFVSSEGKIYTVGYGKFGELGHGDTQTKTIPTAVPNLDGIKIVQVSCGWKHTVCLTDTGAVYSWGDNTYKQLGFQSETISKDNQPKIESIPQPSKTPHRRIISRKKTSDSRCVPTPTKITSLENYKITKIACGASFTAVLTASGDLLSFGRGNYGQLGTGSKSDCAEPVKVGVADVVDFACGSEHVVARTKFGELFVWGWNEHGNLGLGNKENIFSPTKAVTDSTENNVLLVGCGGAHSLVVFSE